MTDIFSNLALGWEVAVSFEALLLCLVGVSVGTFVGVLPGIGPLATISILLPLTFGLSSTNALIMLAGIYYGAQYGGSTTSILLNIPGTATSAVTCIDGYPMTQQGRSGIALCMTTLASFAGGCTAIALMAAFSPSLATVGMMFGPADYFSLMLLGLVAAATISAGSPLKGLLMVALGLALGTVGTDVSSGVARFTFGMPQLVEGLSLIAIAMGLFGVSEIIAGGRGDMARLKGQRIPWRSLVPGLDDLRASVMPTIRGSALGSILGVLPGTGSTIASFVAYAVEKRSARQPARFGKGAIEGVTAPEAANNAASQTAFVPTLTLGIPGDAVMALMLGALMIHGVRPGPELIANYPDLFWGLIVSFWIGNLMLLVLNLPLIGLWVRMLMIPRTFLYPTVIAFMCIGAYSINNSSYDVFAMILFGAIGYGMLLGGFQPAPLLLGFILGPLMEEYMRRALIISRGDMMVFVERPISAAFLTIVMLTLIYTLGGSIVKSIKKRHVS